MTDITRVNLNYTGVFCAKGGELQIVVHANPDSEEPTLAISSEHLKDVPWFELSRGDRVNVIISACLDDAFSDALITLDWDDD